MSTGHRAGAGDRPEYPELKEEHGEDPARYLALEEIDLAIVRIRGIDDLDLLQAWLDVEVDLHDPPRKPIIASINRRKYALEQAE